MSGFLPISRKIFNHPFWKERRIYSRAEALLDLIQIARYEAEPCTYMTKNGPITYGRGQFPASLRFLAERWDWSTKKVNTFLALLQKEETIRIEKETGQNVITLCKYDDYNSFEKLGKQQRNSRETGRKQQGNKYNTGNTGNAGKEGDNIYIGFDGLNNDEVQCWFKYTKWLNEQKFENISRIKNQLKPTEFIKLYKEYGGQEVRDILLAIENKAKSGSTYTSVYLTALNWLKRNQDKKAA